MSTRILIGDCREQLRLLPADSVHCVVTSPPYWGLRDYGTGVWEGGETGCDHVARRVSSRDGIEALGERYAGGGHQATQGAVIRHRDACPCGARRTDSQLGLEPTPASHVASMVEVFREVRRVLRPDGTLWLNYGDSYSGGGGFSPDAPSNLAGSMQTGRGSREYKGRHPAQGLKPKDLVGMPWRIAFALQADGWWLRKDIIWSKPNPMPESVLDRPTSSHEYLFLLTKSLRYFYDAEAIREVSVGKDPGDLDGGARKLPDGSNANSGRNYRRSKAPDGWNTGPGAHGTVHPNGREHGAPAEIRTGRNRRSVWTIATQPYAEAHFATFPEKLVEPCIRAGTSARGVCPVCGAPWVRLAEHENTESHRKPGSTWQSRTDPKFARGADVTTGWRPTCTHALPPIPATVLDPFCGSGTTLAVANRLDRSAIGIELNPDYARLAECRIARTAAQITLDLEAV